VTGPRGPIVIDTDVYSADLSETALIAVYEPIIVGRPAFLSFQTVAELHFGVRRNWGAARMRKLDAKIAAAQVVHSGEDLVATYAHLRAECVRLGHALGQREHDCRPMDSRHRAPTRYPARVERPHLRRRPRPPARVRPELSTSDSDHQRRDGECDEAGHGLLVGWCRLVPARPTANP